MSFFRSPRSSAVASSTPAFTQSLGQMLIFPPSAPCLATPLTIRLQKRRHRREVIGRVATRLLTFLANRSSAIRIMLVISREE